MTGKNWRRLGSNPAAWQILYKLSFEDMKCLSGFQNFVTFVTELFKNCLKISLVASFSMLNTNLLLPLFANGFTPYLFRPVYDFKLQFDYLNGMVVYHDYNLGWVL